MSPRRKIELGEPGLLVAPPPRPPRPWRAIFAAAVGALVILGSITAGALMLYSHESHRRTALNEVAALDIARAFTAEFLSPDPTGDSGANRYVDRMAAQSAGELGKWWQDRKNEILIQVATGPVVKATILDAGVERWNDDGSVDVLVVAKTAIKSADGKRIEAEPTVRCLETVRREGDQWKISNLSPVI
ncbi:hypothetical protein C1Y40_00083 [Mycobacterium talmoniae]|uniref:Mammalian cell entry protein n=2 Tax=Mycobacterium talmoniae TaxID=1858794 RepID=A0A2S8BSS3_9MYCO|nr:hypothetical protein C1Y40_00083 [Mycobacterium talmoniae]